MRDTGNEPGTQALPEGQTVHGLRVGLVLVGIVITIPAFLAGAKLGSALGFYGMALAVALGSLLLLAIGTVVAIIAAELRLTTYLLVERVFGLTGAKIVNSVLALTIAGWFSVTAAFFGDAVATALQQLWGITAGNAWLVVAGTLMVTLTAVFGIRAIDRLALIAVPLLMGILVWLVLLSLKESGVPRLTQYHPGAMSLGSAVTAVVGGFIVGVVILPDFCRFAHNTRHAIIAVLLLFGLAYPALLLLVSLAAIAAGNSDFLSLFTTVGFGGAAVVVIVFATWTTNTGNLYSCTLAMQTIFPRLPHWLLASGIAGVGTALALAGIADYFIDFLLLLGISLPPIVGIYIADYFLRRPSLKVPLQDGSAQPINLLAFGAWFTGILAALAAAKGMLSLTGIPAADAILVASTVYGLLSKATPWASVAAR